ncbi:3',5'-cyclic-nucleotide phosphodiesterase [Thiohalophilus sp.]|uniref:3',5'-cyclic-nucleotide phosphodiesterase n=1 Tax=Thiohalophilus sp. TaxID=3028392 RepID=UPI002ACEE9F4|nr:3',5'-cyclic-nucleotide phosphodiesterase [Thiohalophilus sp.]MDZ7662486.1 3',5'-cyclic-nucleotide phosphodiesterase [Thiohalophilus sp.]
MELQVLGCSGGVGDGLRTTTMMVDQAILIDAGTGVGDLTLEQMSGLRHIFLTHSHLDHIASIPLLVDSVFEHLHEPITIHALDETLDALRTHIFNNVIWPDFAALPHPDRPVLRYQPMQPGETRQLGEIQFEMVPVNHAVPGVGYIVRNSRQVFAFSGDTTTNDTFWARLNQLDRLDMLIVEAAFPDRDIDICRRAGHYCPSLLAADIAKLQHRPEIYISHNKPGDEDEIFDECRRAITTCHLNRLSAGSRFTL